MNPAWDQSGLAIWDIHYFYFKLYPVIVSAYLSEILLYFLSGYSSWIWRATNFSGSAMVLLSSSGQLLFAVAMETIVVSMVISLSCEDYSCQTRGHCYSKQQVCSTSLRFDWLEGEGTGFCDSSVFLRRVQLFRSLSQYQYREGLGWLNVKNIAVL